MQMQVDLVTETDKTCEDLIFHFLRKHYPDHKVSCSFITPRLKRICGLWLFIYLFSLLLLLLLLSSSWTSSSVWHFNIHAPLQPSSRLPYLFFFAHKKKIKQNKICLSVHWGGDVCCAWYFRAHGPSYLDCRSPRWNH